MQTLKVQDKLRLFAGLAASSFLLHAMALAQQNTGGVTESRKNAGSQTTFSYKIQSTYGTTTSAQATGNMTAQAEAILRLKSGSKVTNKFGDDSGNASAVFTTTPTGGNVDLKGITGENILLIDDGTVFRSSLSTIENPNPNVSSTGNASAYATHNSSVIVEKGSTSFENSFQQTF